MFGAERFSRGSSTLHRADTRIKLAAATLFACVTAVLQDFPPALAALGIAAVLVFTARLPLGLVLRRLAAVNLFALFAAVAAPFSIEGEPVFDLGFFTATDAGLALGGLILLKANAIAASFMALAATSRLPELGRGLSGLGAPQSLVLLVMFSYRYLALIAAEHQRLSQAAAMRGFVPRTSRHTLRTIGVQFAMVLVRSIDRAERARQAMALRGFAGEFRTLSCPGLSRGDVLLGAVLLAATATLVWLELRV
jgi:cobalt/nickel transport system permease protein